MMMMIIIIIMILLLVIIMMMMMIGGGGGGGRGRGSNLRLFISHPVSSPCGPPGPRWLCLVVRAVVIAVLKKPQPG